MSELPALLKLPQEILVRVASFLSTVDVGKFRLTCKEIEIRLFDDFATTFFSKRQFMLEHVSLEALVQIAGHAGLAPYLHDVIIATHTYRFHHVETEQMKYYSKGYLSHEALLSTGVAKEMLTEAFSKLPNLRTIGLRDYNGSGRFRDGPDAQWRSYGWSYCGEMTTLYSASPNACLPLILSAAAAAVNALPSKLEVFLHKSVKLSPSAFTANERSPKHSLDRVLSSLKTVMLVVQADEPGFQRSTDRDYQLPVTQLTKFIARLRNLETLRLNFRPTDAFPAEVVRWLGSSTSEEDSNESSTALATSGITPVQLQFLRSLDLGKATIDAKVLAPLLNKLDLESLNLLEIVLVDKGGSTEYDVWAEVLREMAAQLRPESKIGHIMIARPFQTESKVYGISRITEFVPVGTAEDDKHNALKTDRIEFKRHSISAQQWLEEMSRCTYVMRPAYPDSPDTEDYDTDLNDELDDSEELEEYDDDEAILDETMAGMRPLDML